MTETSSGVRLAQLHITPDFKIRIQQAQAQDSEMMTMLRRMKVEEPEAVKQDRSGLWRYKNRICVPSSGDLRRRILVEAHQSRFSMHPRVTKMYQDLKQMFWWPGLKKEVADYVSKCLTFQKMKVEHQKLLGTLQPLEIPQWKWEQITMDFVTELPRTSTGHEAIWVIVDRLTKSSHFLLILFDYTLERLARIYIQEIV